MAAISYQVPKTCFENLSASGFGVHQTKDFSLSLSPSTLLRTCLSKGASRENRQPLTKKKRSGKVSNYFSFTACLLPILALAACTAQPVPGVRPAMLQATAPPSIENYLLVPGDLVAVKFYNNPEFNEDVIVRPDGKISLQLIGDVSAAGLSPEALGAQLTERYAKELAKPRVSVIVRQLGAPPVYVGGEVGHPGVVPLVTGMTLFQAIQAAGGLSVTAHRKQVILIRKGTDGRRAGYSIDVRPIASGAHPEDDVSLGAYDIVFVPTSTIANVDIFVDQYVNRLIPRVPMGFAISP
jgi:protein involved in polysaccharide export with SLBB domain